MINKNFKSLQYLSILFFASHYLPKVQPSSNLFQTPNTLEALSRSSKINNLSIIFHIFQLDSLAYQKLHHKFFDAEVQFFNQNSKIKSSIPFWKYKVFFCFYWNIHKIICGSVDLDQCFQDMKLHHQKGNHH